MSYTGQPRIKQMRQKDNSGNYFTSIPFGADGFLIDMFSGLDLEEELKLGGNHYTEILEDNDTTIIKEWYFSQPKGERSISSTDLNNQGMKQLGLILYSGQIVISDNQIIAILYKGDIDNNNILHQKTIKITETLNSVNINQELYDEINGNIALVGTAIVDNSVTGE